MDIVTSMNKELFYKYGKNSIESLSKNLDKKFRLNIFFEGEIIEDLKKLQVIDQIIKEPLGGAHRNPNEVFINLKEEISKSITS